MAVTAAQTQIKRTSKDNQVQVSWTLSSRKIRAKAASILKVLTWVKISIELLNLKFENQWFRKPEQEKTTVNHCCCHSKRQNRVIRTSCHKSQKATIISFHDWLTTQTVNKTVFTSYGPCSNYLGYQTKRLLEEVKAAISKDQAWAGPLHARRRRWMTTASLECFERPPLWSSVSHVFTAARPALSSFLLHFTHPFLHSCVRSLHPSSSISSFIRSLHPSFHPCIHSHFATTSLFQTHTCMHQAHFIHIYIYWHLPLVYLWWTQFCLHRRPLIPRRFRDAHLNSI